MKRQKNVRPPNDHEFVYGLVCPLLNRIVYVGKSSTSLRTRATNHFCQSALTATGNGPLVAWKNELVGLGLRPAIVLLAVPHYEAADAAEKRWTLHFEELGPVLNIRNTSKEQLSAKRRQAL